ncbi:hypothetical protein [Panacagrimonas sp.]|uniref:hypothetical protein n=1 Tax=Panacagrimonas sp. TaxID=2480088 RepID=UPI003B52E4A9
MILTMRLRKLVKVITAFMFGAGLPALVIAADPEPSALSLQARVSLPALPELSGLAASRRRPGLWWALNDSGNAPTLVALDQRGQVLGSVRVQGQINHDWEDLASFEDEDGRWLLVGDIGDNFGLRGEILLMLLPEPDPQDRTVTPARLLRVSWEDGARDAESLAVDVGARRVLLADKGRRPAGLYAVPLDGPGPTATARRIADFPELAPGPPPRARSIASMRWRGTPTAIDLSPDGLSLTVLTAEGLSLFHRAPGQRWAEALREPASHWVSISRLSVAGYEAAAFSADARSVLIGNEGEEIHLMRWALQMPAGPAP